jgi:hypothetical protein
MAEFASTRHAAEFDDRERDYRTVEPWAIVALVLGAVSAVALLDPLLLLVPLVALGASVVALVRLARDTDRSGRAAALAGLALAIMFGVAPVAQMATTWAMLSRQARGVGDQFFEYLRERSPEKAMMLRFAPDQRRPFDNLLWKFYQSDNEAQQNLRAFVQHPLIKTLLALGPKAQVRFYKTLRVGNEGSRGLVSYLYTVTYSDDDPKRPNAKTTFFVNLLMERKPTENPNINPWRVSNIEGGVNPFTWSPAEKQSSG